MKLIILTQYFPPEVGAPQNRLFGLARHLGKLGVRVTVLTAMPNYPQMRIYPEYRGKTRHTEIMEGITVHRTSIFVSENRSVLSRLRNYFSFVWSSSRASSMLEERYDFLLCESPPLFLGYSAMWLSRKKKAKLIFNVSDLWPESAEKLGVVTNRRFLRMAYRLEARLYRRATLVTGQTQGICQDIQRRFPGVDTYWLPNGVDLDQFDPQAGNLSWRKEQGFGEDDMLFLYAGIIGIAQGLDIILDCAGQLRGQPRVRFLLLGDGPEKVRLMSRARLEQLENVYFFGTVAKSRMREILAGVNAAIVPLKKLDLFKGAIPSKIFENLAMEVPVLLGVDGEARRLFVEEGKCALYFEPGNAGSLSDAVNALVADSGLRERLGKNGRVYVQQHFERSAIAREFFRRLSAL